MKYKFRSELITQKLDRGISIFNGKKSELLTLNESASYIVSLLRKGKKNKDIVIALQKKYEVKKTRAEKDTSELINNLVKLGILQKS